MRPLALITGGAKRLGAEITRRLARDHDVVIHYHSSDQEADTVAAAARTLGAEVVLLKCDLADIGSIESQLIPVLSDRPVSVLVNSAALFEWDTVSSFDPALFQRQMAVNLAAPVLLTKLVAAALPQGAEGSVVNILDQKLWNLNADHMSYTLAKAGLACFTEMAALEYAPRLRVNGIAPGFTLPNPGQTEAEMQAQCADNPLGRASRAEDIAETVAYLAANRSVTGEIIRVDAGARYARRGRDFLFDAT